ncbi:MAG TPA: tetratricopeptide repeat protein [Chromatiales bacterium]|nr:tetratricopeptide repeat protein [Thiotrichales bacterium]HIP69147.1 tetratricopeptide repeat protein [Chromatiales bacterium]
MVTKRFLFLLPILLTGCASLGPQSPSFDTRVVPVDAAVEQRADVIYEVLTAEVAGKMGDLSAASQHYVRASELTNDEAVAERAARIALFARDFDAALKAIDRWSEINPGSLEAHQLAGILYLRKKEPDKAVEHFVAIIESNWDDPEAGFAQIVQLLNGGKVTPEALKIMSALRERYDKEAVAHRSYAELAFRAEKYAESLHASEAALKLNPEDVDARILKNRALFETGQAETALANMRKLVKARPDNVQLQLSYARLLVLGKRYEQALKSFASVLAKRPDDPDLLYSTALLELELKHYAKAEKYLKQLRSTKSHQNEANYYLGEIAQEKQKYDHAIGWYNKVQAGEYYLEAQIRIAEMLAELGRIDEARGHLSRLRKQQSHDALKARLYLAEGHLLQGQEKYQDAMTLFDEAITKYPDDTELLYARAMVGEKMDRLDILERDLNAIIKMKPDNATALNALGYTLADKTDRLQEAQVLIEKALALKPDDPAILDSMGWLKYRMGDLHTALKYLRKAWSKLEDPEVGSHLTQVLWELGQQQQARETLKKALSTAPDDDRLLKLKQNMGQ